MEIAMKSLLSAAALGALMFAASAPAALAQAAPASAESLFHATTLNLSAYGEVKAAPASAEHAARLDAVKALQAKADLYARATGYRVTRLISLGEGGGYAPPRPIAFAGAAEMRAAAPTPVSPGELRVRIEVTGLYE